MEKKNAQQTFDNLSYKKKNVFEESSADEIKAIYEYAKGYMKYLDDAKTEREAVVASIEMIEKDAVGEPTIDEVWRAFRTALSAEESIITGKTVKIDN